MVLLKYPNSILTNPVNVFDFEKLDPLQISDGMINLMIAKGGIGLAANQVGIDARIFVMKTQAGEYLTVINPEILKYSSETVTFQEGCLSFPGLSLGVTRPATVEAAFLDKYANSCIMSFEGVDAICFQHEYDHLSGITFDTKSI